MEFYVGMVVLHHALVYCIIGTRTCVEVEKTAPRNVMQWIVSVANCEGVGLPKQIVLHNLGFKSVANCEDLKMLQIVKILKCCKL